MARDSPETQVVRKWMTKKYSSLGGDKVGTIDIGESLSEINHRLYRQGRVYSAKVNVNTRTLNPLDKLSVYALMPSWYVMSAWRLAKTAYDAALADEKAILSKGNLARWRDFRVSPGVGNDVLLGDRGSMPAYEYAQDAGVPGNFFTAIPRISGEFNYSRVEDVDSVNNFTFSWPWLSLSSAEFDIMAEFAESRSESSLPDNILTDMPYKELNSDAEDGDFIELQANGNEPPYQAVGFTNAVWVKVGTLQATQDPTSTTWTSSTGYFDAPCGLVAIVNDATEGELNAIEFHVEVAKGDYRGVKAPPM